jgi:hypothetical protein
MAKNYCKIKFTIASVIFAVVAFIFFSAAIYNIMDGGFVYLFPCLLFVALSIGLYYVSINKGPVFDFFCASTIISDIRGPNRIY